MKKINFLLLIILLFSCFSLFAESDCDEDASGETPCTFERADKNDNKDLLDNTEVDSDSYEDVAAENEDFSITINREITSEKVHIYFFKKKGCTRCKEAAQFLDEIQVSGGSVVVHSFSYEEHSTYFNSLFTKLELEYKSRISGFPVIVIGEKLWSGFDEVVTSKQINTEIERVKTGVRINENSKIVDIPLIGKVEVEKMNLLQFTINIGLIDGLNPCAIWVLMVLLSLMIRAESRRMIALVGSIFVITSGMIYFFFMSAWLNIFTFIGFSKWVTILLGILALGIGLINIKELFFFKSKVSLMIPEGVKPKLYQKIRHLFKEKNMLLLITGTISFAVFVNLIELGCTIGLPAVYTRVLSLREIPQFSKYLYMGLYCTAYVVPLFIIVLLFFITLGRFTLTEKIGKVLKVVNGVLMLMLGIALLVFPELLLG